MALVGYIVRCHAPGCSNPAEFKIASRWSDGITGELKTYSLCCRSCLRGEFVASRHKQSACRLAVGETLEPPGIYRLHPGLRDQNLVRETELEFALTVPAGN